MIFVLVFVGVVVRLQLIGQMGKCKKQKKTLLLSFYFLFVCVVASWSHHPALLAGNNGYTGSGFV